MTTANHVSAYPSTSTENGNGRFNDSSSLTTSDYFSALVPSLKPSIASCLIDQDEVHFDEFGFQINEQTKTPSPPFIESPANRRAWITCLEFSYTYTLGTSSLDDYDTQYTGTVGSTLDEEEDQLWSRVHTLLVPSPRLTDLIRGQAIDVLTLSEPSEQLGIPHSLRPHIWPRLIGALDKSRRAKKSDPPITYSELVQLSSSDSFKAGFQIEKDLFRTLPNNICFCSSNSTGISRLRRLLRAIAWFYMDVGYCQGMGLIAATLLLCLEEENAFWILCSIIEDVLPPSYYSSASLLGVQADQAVLCDLVASYLPELDQLLKNHDIELSLITLQWFLTLYAGVCSTAITLRIWDLLFYEGSVTLFRFALAILMFKLPDLLELKNSSQLFSALSAAPGSIPDMGELIKIAYSFDDEFLNPSHIASLRRHYLAQLLVEDGAIIKSDSQLNLPKQYLAKRQLGKPRSFFRNIFNSMATPGYASSRHHWFSAAAAFHRSLDEGQLTEESMDEADPKLKNVRQTEVLVELKQAIRMIIRHFRQSDPQYDNATAQADYSMEGHALDWENYVQVAQRPQHRAKALSDFERQEPDELGFAKNDIITVINTDDEHCWYGKLAEAQGWFPARFVELLDERGKDYSAAGDDSVDSNIASLVRGNLCTALNTIFTYGLKKTRLLGNFGCHPWNFIEAAATKEVERDFSSVYSRLILCKTFRLDEEGKVLSPEEVLFRAVHSINISHDVARAHMDVKFRSLICYGLNEQLLHLWLETLCSSVKVIERWYHPWSYLRSPGWVQIKCELRLLNQFSFRLSPTYELDSTTEVKEDWPKRLHKPFSLKRLKPLTIRPSSLAPRSGPVSPAILDDFCVPSATQSSANSQADAGDMLIKYHLFSWEL